MKLWIECARKLKEEMDEQAIVGTEENRERITELVKVVFPDFQEEETATVVQIVIGGIESAKINPNRTIFTVADGARTAVTLDEFHAAVGDCPTIKIIGGGGDHRVGKEFYSVLLENGFELNIKAAVNEKGQPYLELKTSKGPHNAIA